MEVGVGAMVYLLQSVGAAPIVVQTKGCGHANNYERNSITDEIKSAEQVTWLLLLHNYKGLEEPADRTTP